ncbi:MAG: M20 family metallopeptidase [Actinobacteria bacterium]|nr:MAG: M20 family metallopeptidase [Actinomycetota bacterium]
MLELLRELVEIESPTYTPGVRAVADRMGSELATLGANVSMLDGDHLRAELGGSGEPLLVVGHTDTVWPVGTLESMPFRVDGDHAFGPGVYDMKSCLVVLVEAIRLAGAERRTLRVFLTADEEMGSPTARPLLEAAADGVAAALVVEPPGSSGKLKTSRKGLGRFRLTIHGRPAHAGTHRHKGVSAIDELAHQIHALNALNDPERGTTLNVGVVSGGTSENVVAAEAQARVDVRVATMADRDEIERALAKLEPVHPEAKLELGGGWTRPPLERSEGAGRLFEQARTYGRELGLELDEESSGGGSDGNLLGAVGVPVLDGLGAEGGGAHAPDEHVVLPSLPVRAQLLSRLLRNPGV